MGIGRTAFLVIAAAGLLAADVSVALCQEPPQRLGDLRTGAQPRGSNPTQILVSPTHVFAVAEVDNNGAELVAADRFTGAVTLRTDLEPGAATSMPALLGVVGDTLIFEATRESDGAALWTSDGTPSGTVRRLPIAQVAGNVDAFEYYRRSDGATVVGGRVFLKVGGRLLVSDDAGATYVELLAEGAGWPVAFGDRVVFLGYDPQHGIEPWISDGTVAGTSLIADIRPGGSSGDGDQSMAVTSGGVYFAANDGVHGSEPWFTDGTAGGTRLVADIGSGVNGSSPRGFFADGDTVYFGTRSGVWCSDGSAAGTTRILTASDGAPGFLGRVGGHVLFTYDDFSFADLWATDGTRAGTTLLFHAEQDQTRRFAALGVAGGRLLFVGDVAAPDEPPHVRAMATDGTPLGTVPVDGLFPSAESAASPVHAVDGGEVFVAAFDPAAGMEVIATDGTPQGTRVAANLETDLPSSDPSPIGILPGIDVPSSLPFEDDPPPARARLVFAATGDGVGREPWITDGTAAGTSLLADIRPGAESSDPVPLAELGRFIVFTADDGVHGREPWITDGTPAGTALVKDVRGGPLGSAPFGPVRVVSRRAVFFADDGPHGVEPWATDGTADGTRLLADTAPGQRTGIPVPEPEADFIPVTARLGRDVCFVVKETDIEYLPGGVVATGPASPAMLWATDGTPQGTRRVAKVGGTGEHVVAGPVAAHGRLLFVASREELELSCRDRLWTSGGTARTTRAGPVFSRDGGPCPVTSDFVYSMEAAALGRSLIGPDAFADESSVLVLRPGRGGGIVSRFGGEGAIATEMVVTGDRALFLSADGGYHGGIRIETADTTLRATDGTKRGTRGLLGPSLKSMPRRLTPLARTGRAAFAMSDPGQGEELWTTDGTAAGTLRVADLRPGPGSSSPSDFVLLGGALLCSADDGISGRELWSVPVAGTAALPESIGDVDGDTYPDGVEIANSEYGVYFHVLSAQVPTSVADDLVVDRLSARLDFAQGRRDRWIVSGWWDPPTSGAVPMRGIPEREAGAIVAGTGDLWASRPDGAGFSAVPDDRRAGSGRVRIRRAPNGGARVRFRFEFRGDFSGGLAPFGIEGTRDVTADERTLPVFAAFRGNVAESPRTVSVTVRGTKGRFRLARAR